MRDAILLYEAIIPITVSDFFFFLLKYILIIS